MVRAVRFHFPDGLARRCRDRSDSLRRLAELDRTDEFSGHAAGIAGCDRLWRNVREGQRPHQSAEVLSHYDRHYVSGGGTVADLRTARAFREWGDCVIEARDGDHWTDCQQ